MAEASQALAQALGSVRPVPQSEPRLLTIPQAATYLGCTVWAIRSLIWERKIPSIKLGKRLLLDRTDLDSFIDSHKRGQ